MSKKQMLRRLMTVGMAASVIAAGAGVASALTIQGPSSSATPYLVPSSPNVSQVVSIMTVGDSVNLKPDGVTPYRAVGLMDGLGAYDNGNGTFTVLMNHEVAAGLPFPNITGSTAATVPGVVRAHGAGGSFVSEWVINKSDLSVVSVNDFLGNQSSLFLSNNNPTTGTGHTGYLSAGTSIISRLCSADLARTSAYGFTDANGTFFGTNARIFQSGEEDGGIINTVTQGIVTTESTGQVHLGRQFAFIATDDSNIAGNQANTAYELAHGGLFAWENNLASPLAQRKTVVIGLDDSNSGQLYVWVGEKQTTGNVVERAGLTRQSANDNLFVIRVNNLIADGTGATSELRGSAVSGTFSLQSEGDVSGLTLAGLETLSDSKGGTQFLRPEDGAWDTISPNRFWFVTTDRYDQIKDGVGIQDGRSRLYALDFTDITNPTAGGTITAFLDGTEAGNMFDNITVNELGQIIIQEDPGNVSHNAKVWLYDPATDGLTQILKHDSARFGELGVSATSPFSIDEESSGVIDVSDILGEGWYLATVQAHRTSAPFNGEVVEGGQLLAFQIMIPEPATMSLLGVAGLVLMRRNRRIA